ncbi:poly-gamma-glutamate biosynthesis protein PgsC/CapC [Natrialba sp. PRR66]|uniref:poly-gamma-glutamate biosynthesis protein PgsC/CapC n=1 Tax=Natrialba sp. PRR66 TaxID=3098146 RepID=UPI002B1D79EF|nr:poly-gamma-glutamate biosynthesis protein PgsC/CapC [Natrialba sp. PRR66]
MIVAAAITILGIAIGIGVTQYRGLRMGGVIVVPLLAVYSLYSFEALPLFLVTATLAYCLVGLIRRHTLIYGRQLLLVSLAAGALGPVTLALVFNRWAILGSTVELAFTGTILPGIAAYNYHKLDPEDRRLDLLVSAGLFVGLVAIAAALVSPTLATQLRSSLTSILFTPASDIAQYRNAVAGSVPTTTTIDRVWMLCLFLGGLVLSELAHARWGVRLGGLIAIPLLVALSIANAWTLGVFLAGVVVVYASITAINAITLIYGRVLLSLSVITAMGYGVLVASVAPTTVGFSLYFTVLLAGISAYNYHRVASAERLESVALAAALYALLLAGTRTFVEPRETGILTTVSAAEFAVLLGAVLFGIYCMHRLETRRQTVANYHSRQVLA